MNWQLLIPLLITTLVAILGWVIGHRMNVARDRIAKRRDLRLQYLIEAYRALENFAGRQPPFSTTHVEGIEKAVADIQLFGSQSQIDLLNKAFAEKRKTGGADLNEIINELRSELRKELDLPELNSPVTWLRFDSKMQSK
jgi:hypothetical protein